MSVSSATVEKAITSTLRLRYTPMSPFARNVLVAAHETDMSSKLDLVTADVWTISSTIIHSSKCPHCERRRALSRTRR